MFLFRFQIWRAVTCVFYFPLSPQTGFKFLINLYFLYSYRYCHSLFLSLSPQAGFKVRIKHFFQMRSSVPVLQLQINFLTFFFESPDRVSTFTFYIATAYRQFLSFSSLFLSLQVNSKLYFFLFYSSLVLFLSLNLSCQCHNLPISIRSLCCK